MSSNFIGQKQIRIAYSSRHGNILIGQNDPRENPAYTVGVCALTMIYTPRVRMSTVDKQRGRSKTGKIPYTGCPKKSGTFKKLVMYSLQILCHFE